MLLLSSVLLMGCPAECIDLDGDGFGQSCELGPDCDDEDANRNVDCAAVDCAVFPTAPGCSCPFGMAECYPYPEETRDVGPCQAGVTRCLESGFWGECEALVGPRIEFCNEQDDDCDGRVDEFVESPCGGCDPECIGSVWGSDVVPFEENESLVVNSRGELSLRTSVRSGEDLWVANAGDNTISRIRTPRLREIARYRSGGASPSRVAVDYLGDAFIANREFGGVGSLTKIAGDESRCIDRNENGVIDTSAGALMDEDECVLFTVAVGEVGEIPRALIVDASLGPDGSRGGNIWLGLHDGEAILEIDGETGETLRRIETPDFQPYAAAFDLRGTLWMISRDGKLLSYSRVARETPVIRLIPLACFELYGLDIDQEGRVYLSGFACDQVTRFDPLQERWTSIETPPSVRGMVVDDANERVWVAHTDGRLSEIGTSPFVLLETYNLAGPEEERPPFESIGVAMSGGNPWVVSSTRIGDTPPSIGVATRIDGEAPMHVDVGIDPHTQGDLSGSKRAAILREEGRTRLIVEGCTSDPNTVWGSIFPDVDPGLGEIEIRTRHAQTIAELADADFETLGTLPGGSPPFPLDIPSDHVLELELILRAGAPDVPPLVRTIGVEWSCPGPR